jgi:uncharacterized protein
MNMSTSYAKSFAYNSSGAFYQPTEEELMYEKIIEEDEDCVSLSLRGGKNLYSIN